MRIPKQNDREILAALQTICDELKIFIELSIQVQSPEPISQQYDLPAFHIDNRPTPIEFVLVEESQLILHFRLKTPQNQIALQIRRDANAITDDAIVVVNDNNLINKIPQDKRSETFVKLNSLSRKYLRVADAEAALKTDSNSEWSRYRDAQQAILDSLARTQLTILEDFSRKALEQEATSAAKLREREAELAKKYEILNEALTNEHKAKVEALEAREGALTKRESGFNTKEARYVARSEQQKQIEQIKGWLEAWSLTRGTRSKRWVVSIACGIGFICAVAAAVWFGMQNA